MNERHAFIVAWLHDTDTVTGLCSRFGISRKTGYKWITRFKAEGMPGLVDHSRARLTQAHRTDDTVVARILALKQAYPDWGPITIQSRLYREDPSGHWPASSTIGAILKRHGLVRSRGKRHKTPPHSQPLAHAIAPNAVWSADFKGHFRLGNGRYCYPLTVTDNYSRYLLACRGLYGPDLPASRQAYIDVFREHGLPDAIRTDNGWPFAMNVLGGLSPLAIWLLKLDVLPERIAPGRPSQNGRHERMHRTLKAAVASPPKGNLSAQQRAFNRFRHDYNHVRPHRSLGRGVCPSDRHAVSPRAYPEQLPEMHYPDEYQVRKVKCGGYIKLHGRPLYTTRQLTGEHVGLKALDDGRWQLYFGRLALGVIDERLKRLIRPT